MKNIAKALIEAQGNMEPLLKDAKNPHFKSDYATLHNVIQTAQKPLADVGLCVFETTTTTESGGAIQHLLLVHAESGESIESSIPLRVKDNTNPQQLGSAQTYARRYLWLNLGLAPQDDDCETVRKAESVKPVVPPDAPVNGVTKQIGTEQAVTKAQIAKISILFNELGRADKKHDDMTKHTGRKIKSTTELTAKEASDLIERMEKAVKKAVAA